jgi:uncharacterized HAD superfamily protein
MTSPLKIGVDIDGVLVDTDNIAYLNYCETVLGWNIDYPEFKRSHSWPASTGKTAVDMAVAFRGFLSTSEHSQKPVSGACDFLLKISRKADIFLITARKDTLKDITEEFVNNYLSEISNVTLSMDNHENKTPRLLEYELDYFIDDSITEISKIIEADNLKTQIIPFPTFHIQSDWSKIKNNKNIIWLDVWNHVNDNLDKKQKEAVQKKAWEEISQRICF